VHRTNEVRVQARNDGGGRVRLTVGLKLAIAIAAIHVAAAVVGGYWIAERERRELFARKEQASLRVAEQVALALSAPLEFDDDLAVREALRGVAADPELVHVRVLDRDRAQIVASDGAEVEPPACRHSGSSLVWADDVLWICQAVGEGAEIDGALVLGISAASEHAHWQEKRERILAGALVFASLVAGLLLAAARKMVLVPLSRLADAADAFGRGEPIVLPATRPDEVGRLAHSFGAMVQAIGERERRLAEAHAEVGRLLDAMRQAVFGFGPDLRVVGRSSRSASRIFGRESLAGVDVRELLLAGQPDGSPEAEATQLFLETIFSVPLAAWAEALELAPREVTLCAGGDDERVLVLEFVPLADDDRLARVMVVVTDETEERRIKREMQALHDHHAAEIEATRRLLGMGANVFVQFVETTHARLACVQELLVAPTHALVCEVMRQVHAVRGDARTLGLVQLAKHLTIAESVLADVRDSVAPPPVEAWTVALREELAHAEAEIVRTRARLVSASPLGEDVLEQTTVSARDLDRLGELEGEGSPELRRCIARLRGRMLGSILIGLGDAVGAWAALEGKRVELELVGATTRLDADRVASLRTAIVQLVRNAIAHGVEMPGERARAGKPTVGRIRIAAEPMEHGVAIEVADDGAGIDFAALAERAKARAIAVAGDDLPFVAGLSTRAVPDALAGRGVGLAAVREELDRCGYAIEIESTPGAGTRIRMTPIAAMLRPRCVAVGGGAKA
jgi:HAMP domain-containing protein/anti-sigma regulatory factor (Ser/Thr protein kinase)